MSEQVTPQVDPVEQMRARIAAERGVSPDEVQFQVVEGAQGPSTGQAEGQGPLLTGERQTGSYTMPSGTTVSHEVTGDGMKQTRIVGPSYPEKTWKSAAHFHAEHGVATAGELEKVNGKNEVQQGRMRRAMGRIGLSRRYKF